MALKVKVFTGKRVPAEEYWRSATQECVLNPEPEHPVLGFNAGVESQSLESVSC